MEVIQGYVDHIIFRNEENGYSVLSLIADEAELTCVGVFPILDEGEALRLSGSFTTHPSYGEQFQVTSCEHIPPEDRIAAQRYLASGAIRGIGAALAARITERFGDDTFRVMEEEPERLAEVKGISERKARDIASQMLEKKDLRAAMIYLQQYGISLALAVKIYQTYGQELYQVIKTNPYRLADDLTGVGFRIADSIAAKVGIHADSDFRIRSGILYMMSQAALNGHTCLPEEILTRNTSQMLAVDPEAVTRLYMDLMIEHKLIMKEKDGVRMFFSAPFFYREENVAYMLHHLNGAYAVPEDALKRHISRMEEEMGITLDELQTEAVWSAVQNGLFVITGGPGTGKTTIINMIICYFDENGYDFLLAAPTGRAAKRMSETTGYEASTIHRMLEANAGADGIGGFERNEDNPLEVDAIIIDEMSMVDISLMHSLLRAVMPGTRLILVGDADQLPSVGPGEVLRSIIESGICKVVRLNRIFRQAAVSDIVVNAHKINAGKEVSLSNDSREFFFLKRYDAERITNVCVQLIRDKLPGYVDAKPYDIQLLTPMRKGLLGVEHLNVVLQECLNPPARDKEERQHAGRIFREGDKVMQIRNNYQLVWQVYSRYGIVTEHGEGVFNGDLGVIRTIDPFSELVTVEYDESRLVEYEFSQLDELELAYAVTIHKSQGSEYPAVVIPLLTGPSMLMNRNLLYTAVTRARNCVVLVGDEKTFAQMIQNESPQKRYTGLTDRLKEERDLR